MIIGYFDYLVIGILVFLNIKYWRKKIKGIEGYVIGAFLFLIVLPLFSQIIEIQRVKMTIGIVDNFEILYTYLRFPTYWIIGSIQVLIIVLKKVTRKNKRLLSDLKKAENILSERKGGSPSGNYLTVEDFHKDFVDRVNKLENGDLKVIDDLWIWFAPTCQWDDYGGNIYLGERIFYQLNKLKNKASSEKYACGT